MNHPIFRIEEFRQISTFELWIRFDDGSERTVDFSRVLSGPLYGPLADPHVFSGAVLDNEIGTITWPNGADFDPMILHDWPTWEERFIEANHRREVAA